MDIKNDDELVQSILFGDRGSFDVLVHKYFKMMYSFVFRNVGSVADCEDIIQEVWLKVWGNLKKFDLQKSFKTWLYTIAYRTCIDHLRKKKSTVFSSLDTEDMVFSDTISDTQPLASDLVDKKILEEDFEKALSTLTFSQKSVLQLYYKEQMNFREIAELTNESVDTIKSRHRRGVKALAEYLKNKTL